MRLPTLAPVCIVLALSSACGEDDEPPFAPIGNLDGGGVTGGDGSFDAMAPDATSCVDSIGYEDFDRDGFTRAQGDCDDCDMGRGPGAIDLPNNGVDEDCSGGDATSPLTTSCDQALKPEATDIEDVVQALGLCAREVSRPSLRPGLVDARWQRLGDGERPRDARQVWLPERFGRVEPHEGGRMLVLSTGVARDSEADDYTPGCDAFGSMPDGSGGWTEGTAPPEGFPQDSKLCPKDTVSKGTLAYDDVGLALTMRAPGNVTAITFDSIFYTYEYPDFVCSRYNDFFVALIDPAPKKGLPDDSFGNVLFDDEGNPIGVNTALLSVCTKTKRSELDLACSLGSDFLTDTGYGAEEASCAPLPKGESSLGGAATGWLHTEMPVSPGALFTLHFVLWDSGDPLLDSTVVIDNVRFIATPATPGTKPFTSR